MALHVAREAGSGRVALAGLLLSCLACWMRLSAAQEAFDYGILSGPAEWGGTCSTGKSQAPLNISTAGAADEIARAASSGLEFDYGHLQGVTVFNTGFGPQVRTPAGNLLTTAGGQQWRLTQFHFHTPSENALDGHHAAMEAHLVHQNVATGELAVVGVLLETECPPAASGRFRHQWCSAVQQALDLMPPKTGDESEPHNLDADTLSSLLPGAGVSLKPRRKTGGHRHRHSYPYAHFNGSLTTPPCTEGVSWYVLLDPSPVGPAQVLRFEEVVGHGLTLASNARPVQPLSGRTITFGRGHNGVMG